jgi:uncharacterized protein YcbX
VAAAVSDIFLSPVKSLRLERADQVELGADGIPADRRFALVEDTGRVMTLRRVGRLARATSRWDAEQGELEVAIEDGPDLRGVPADGGPVELELWDRRVPARLVEGPWAEPLSELAGRRLRLVSVGAGLRCLDAHPVSILSRASVEALARQAGEETVDPRRFRPNLLVEGCAPHAEDGWVGRRLQVGEAILRVVAYDARCALTTRNPTTGDRDLDTLRHIAAYRPPVGGDVLFGVYARVERPGPLRVGDPVVPLDP